MMHTYRIVAGVDGSEGGRKALRWAVHQAAQRHGVVQAVIAYRYDDPAAGESDLTAQRAAAMELLDHELNAMPPAERNRVPIAAEAVEGRAADVLSAAAADADLLVIGSHERSRAWRTAVGSVSEGCVRVGGCPVVVIPVAAD